MHRKYPTPCLSYIIWSQERLVDVQFSTYDSPTVLIVDVIEGEGPVQGSSSCMDAHWLIAPASSSLWTANDCNALRSNCYLTAASFVSYMYLYQNQTRLSLT